MVFDRPYKVFQVLGNFACVGHDSKEEPSASVGREAAGPQTPQGGEQGGEQTVGDARKEDIENRHDGGEYRDNSVI